MNNEKKLKDIVFAFDLGANAGMVYDSGPFSGDVKYEGGSFEYIKEQLLVCKKEIAEKYNYYGPRYTVRVIFYLDKWGWRRVEASLAEKRGMIQGILFDLKPHFFIKVIKLNESAVYSQMRKLHPSPIKEKKWFTVDLLQKVYALYLNQDASDAALLYFYYCHLIAEGEDPEMLLTLKN